MRIHPRGGILAVLAVVLVTLGVVAGVSAAAPTLRVEPAGQTVAKGASFTVRVVTNAAVPTSGAQATVTFDQTKVQITSVTRGTPHASSSFFLPANMAGAIASANTSGTLVTVATAFLPPASIPAGDADFLIIGFTAIACGESPLGLPVGPGEAELLDGTDASYGNSLTVTSTGGKVTVPCSGASPTPTASGASPTPTASGASPTPTASGASPTPTALAATPTPTGAVEGVVGGPSSTAPPTDTLPAQTNSTSDWWLLALGGLAAFIAIRFVDALPQAVRRRR